MDSLSANVIPFPDRKKRARDDSLEKILDDSLEKILDLDADETRELVERLRAEAWGSASETMRRFVDALEVRAKFLAATSDRD